VNGHKEEEVEEGRVSRTSRDSVDDLGDVQNPRRGSVGSAQSDRRSVGSTGSFLSIVQGLGSGPTGGKGKSKPRQSMRRASTTSRFSVDSNAKMQKIRKSIRATRDEANFDEEDEEQTYIELLWEQYQSFVASWTFELVFACAIGLDACVVGAQTQYSATLVGTAHALPAYFSALQHVFAVIFSLELFLRILAHRWDFFCDREASLGWNYFDVLVVFGSLLEMALGAAGETMIRRMRMIRILRLIRILRVVRIIRFVTALRTLVMCIGSTLKSLMWSLVLLFLIMYTIGIAFTDSCTDYLKDVEPDILTASYAIDLEPDTQAAYAKDVRKFFGSLPVAVKTLFESISNGNTWGEVLLVIWRVDPAYGMFFFMYISFCVFAVLNVMTGVFCQAAIESAAKDQELIAQALIVDKARDVEQVRSLFKSMDSNGDGMLDLLELEECFENQQIRALFASLDIHLDNSWQLFHLLDADGKGSVDAMDFVDLCMKVRGPAKSIDMACLSKGQKRIRAKLASMENHIQEDKTKTEKLLRDIWRCTVLQAEPETALRLSAIMAERHSKRLEEKSNGVGHQVSSEGGLRIPLPDEPAAPTPPTPKRGKVSIMGPSGLRLSTGADGGGGERGRKRELNNLGEEGEEMQEGDDTVRNYEPELSSVVPLPGYFQR